MARVENIEKLIVTQSDTDRFVSQLLQETNKAPDVWYAGAVQINEQFKSRFKLPDELCDGHPDQIPDSKNFSYVWVEVDDERIARMYVADYWIPVNRTNHPWMPEKYFTTLGTLEVRGYSRHVLFYQPKDYNMQKKEADARRFQERKEGAQDRLEGLDGKVRFDERVNISGGYGLTPEEPPIQTDEQGNRLSEQETFDYID